MPDPTQPSAIAGLPVESGRAFSTLVEEKHVRALDGLRGLAFLSVFAFHSYGQNIALDPAARPLYVKAASYGWLGVDLFFVLSGYLITGILRRSRNSAHYYRNFYARRALRIFPIYYLAVAAVFFLQPFLRSHLGTGTPITYPWRIQVWYWLNLSNISSAFAPFAVLPLIHFWSLGIEEQFYLVWPTIVKHTRRDVLLVLLGVALLAGEVARNLPGIVRLTERYPNLTYRLTPFHLDGLLCGAILALLLDTKWKHSRTLRLLFAMICTLTLLSVCTMSVFATETTWASFKVRWSTLAAGLFFAASLGLLLSDRRDSLISRVLSSRSLCWIGVLSYCLYVIHLFALEVGQKIAAHIPWVSAGAQGLVAPPIGLALGISIAVVSRIYIESPALRLKRHFPSR